MHWLFPLLILIRVLDGAMKAGGTGAAYYGFIMVALFATVLIHELGHCFAARSRP